MSAVPELRPFTALRPLPQLASRVAAPPYDVVDAEQARAAMLAAPDSFLRVTRPDADPWLEAAPAPGEEHEHGRQALADLVRRGVLVREEAPSLWVYRQRVPRSGVSVARAGGAPSRQCREGRRPTVAGSAPRPVRAPAYDRERIVASGSGSTRPGSGLSTGSKLMSPLPSDPSLPSPVPRTAPPTVRVPNGRQERPSSDTASVSVKP